MSMLAEIDENDPTKIKITQPPWAYKELLDSLPSSKYNRDDTWNFSLTWQTCLALQSTFRDKLTIGPKLRAWADALYNDVVLPAYTMRSEITPPGWEDVMPDINLFPHQKGDVAFLSTVKRGMLFNGMGSGKSISSFAAVRKMYEDGEDVFPVLIACPNSTKLGWKKEIHKVWPGLNVTVIDGTAAQRKKQFDQINGLIPCVLHNSEAKAKAEKAAKSKKKTKTAPAPQICTCGSHVVIINWESIRSHSKLAAWGGAPAMKRCTECKGLDPSVKTSSCEAHAKELNFINFQTVIGDEIHRIKDAGAKTARAFKAATGKAPFRIGLSGTPLASTPDDLFSPLHWLMPEAYPNKNKFINRMCVTADSAWGQKIVIGIRPEMEQEFFSGIDPFTRRMAKEVILPFLPPIVYERRDVEMGAKQKKAYEQMRDLMLAEVEAGEVIYTTSPLTKLTRLLQFSSAFAEVEYKDVYNPKLDMVENKAVVRLTDPSCKLDAFMDDFEDFGDESIVVFAVSSQLINMLSARLEKAKIPHGLITGDQDAAERQVHMDNFQAGHTKVILCTIAAGGTGITLTAGSTAVFLQRSWSMIENMQAEARVHRIGSEKFQKIRILDYVTIDSSEEIVFEAVAAKMDQLEFILRDKEQIRKFLNNELSIKPNVKENE